MLDLVRVDGWRQWDAYHDIRRRVLFEGRGRLGLYDENHPDDRSPSNHALLLLDRRSPRGAVRLDIVGSRRAVVRTVAIAARYQRVGLGRSMMTLVEDYALARDIATLEVNSASDAVAFYLRLGWTLVDPDRETPLLTKILPVVFPSSATE